MSNIETWAENLTKEVFTEYKEKYSFWPHGFKVFYSPVVMHPDLMIISFQPGGSDFGADGVAFEKGDFSLPKSNGYTEESYAMAQKVRGLFGSEGLELLRRSVILPLIFFRAPNVNAWKRIPQKERKNMEHFCLSKVSEIIGRIEPKKILVFGMATYDLLKKDILFPVLKERVVQYRKNERMVVRAECVGHTVLTIMHPTGARIGTKDRLILKRAVQRFI